MSKQNSLDKYFGKRKENNDVDKLANRSRIENENIITQSNIIANDSYDLINNSTTTDIQSIEDNSIAVFSGIHNGVAARFRDALNIAILFIYCRAHLLQLAVISAAEDSSDISRSLSALKSLDNFINRSSVRLSLFENIQDIFRNQHIKLIQPGDTSWLSNSLAIRSLLQSYQSLLITLESIYNENNEDSEEAQGLYNNLSNEGTAFILHALQPILDTLATLSKSIQTKAADFKQLQGFVTSTLLRVEQLKDYCSDDYIAIIRCLFL
ncbi:unnamed protein product [Rotaria sp. Silwood2]|nr:unnamed protein product [Rotaria sp. Silwood2]